MHRFKSELMNFAANLICLDYEPDTMSQISNEKHNNKFEISKIKITMNMLSAL